MRGEAQGDAGALLDGLDLDRLLAALVRTRGFDPALRDPPGRAGWSGVAPQALSFAELDSRVRALAGLLATNRAEPGSAVAILAPLGPELIVSILACLRCGLAPLPLSPAESEDAMLATVEAAGATMAIGIGQLGPLRPLDALRNVALRSFGMRFLGGFGGDVPDGVVPLDALMASGALHPLPAFARRAPILVPNGEQAGSAALAERDLLGPALRLSQALKPMGASRIVTTLVGGDLAALATGPAAALLTGVELMPLGLFELGELRACIEAGRSVHLVIPAAMEPALAASRLGAHPALASLIVVRRGGEQALPALDRPDLAVVDVAGDEPTELTIVRR